MALEIFKLVGSVFVDTEKANDSLAKTDKKAEGLGKTLLKGAGTVAKWGTAAVAAASVVGGAMIASAKETASNADVVDKASQRMKISAEGYQELAYQAELCGVNMSTMEKAAKKLEGTDMTMDEALASIYELGTAEERAAKASELFGEAVAYQMTPMLNASGEEMANMAQEARDLGLVMSEDTVKSGAEMNDTFTKVQASIDSVKNEIGAAFMPIINDLLQWVIKHMPEIKAFVSDTIAYIKNVIERLEPIIVALAPAFQKAFEFIGHIWKTVLQPVFDGIIDFLEGVFTGNWEKVFNGLVSIVEGIFSGIVELVKIPINNMIKVLNIFIAGLNKIKIPEWVGGLLAGKGFNIPEIPMLAEGGEITKSGSVLVGERGPEFLNLPRGASVTPLDKAQSIDYEKLASAIVGALQTATPALVKVVPDESNIFNVVCEQQQFAINSGRTGIMV